MCANYIPNEKTEQKETLIMIGGDYMRNLYNGTLVKLMVDENFVKLITYSRKLGHKQIYINRDRLEAWVFGGFSGIFCARDGLDMLYAETKLGHVHIRITWLTGELERVHGYIEQVDVPERFFLNYTWYGQASQLYYERNRRSKLDFRRVHQIIAEICADKLTKRAFIKGLSKCFQWHGSEIIFCREFIKQSFGFQEHRSSWPINGGFIRHDINREINGRTVPVVTYEVHT